jgi:hypothetical protein
MKGAVREQQAVPLQYSSGGLPIFVEGTFTYESRDSKRNSLYVIGVTGIKRRVNGIS